MAIPEEHFQRRFMRLEAYFMKTVKKAHIEEWWEACRNWDYSAFDKTMSALEREEHFPTFPQMRAMYGKFKPMAERENSKESKYCGYCISGHIHFWKNDNDDRSYVAFCQRCLELNGEHRQEYQDGLIITMDPLNPNINWIDDPGEHNNATQIKLKPEMVRELVDKLTGHVTPDFKGYDEIPF